MESLQLKEELQQHHVLRQSARLELRLQALELLDLLSHHVATVLENAQLYESATIDPLTRLLRREAIQIELEAEICVAPFATLVRSPSP